ncbi:MAG: response regulator [Alphaproteobacteria bacterium]|nr:response regulator [Alphaproteobacteria bacterium]
MTNARPTVADYSQQKVYIVDGDAGVRRLIAEVASRTGHPVEQFATGGEFLRSLDAKSGGCIVLDLRLPDMGGLDVQRRVRELGSQLPIIIISGHADVESATTSDRKCCNPYPSRRTVTNLGVNSSTKLGAARRNVLD